MGAKRLASLAPCCATAKGCCWRFFFSSFFSLFLFATGLCRPKALRLQIPWEEDPVRLCLDDIVDALHTHSLFAPEVHIFFLFFHCRPRRRGDTYKNLVPRPPPPLKKTQVSMMWSFEGFDIFSKIHSGVEGAPFSALLLFLFGAASFIFF